MIAALAISSLLLAPASGLAGLVLRRRPTLGQRLSCVLLCTAAALGIAAAIPVLAGSPGFAVTLPWREPFASFSLRLDALSALFLVPILAIPALGAVYGLGYWPQAERGGRAVRLQLVYGTVAGAMALVVLADNALLFLFGWEVMAVCGFLLVLAEPDRPEARRAAWVYLAAAHVGTFALFAFFSIVGSARGSFDFSAWTGLDPRGAAGATLFGLLVAGFGLKAGLVPLHFWLPGAHAAAPAHVSALMSGVLLKTGIYGLFRTTGLFDAPPASWGAWLLALGVVSGVLGVALALMQHDLKRLLAYHSVENIGIIAMGLGLALLGRSRSAPALLALGFAGAALHVTNHAAFKSLLFLGAGSVEHAAGSRDLERLGGLARRMPLTAALFLTGAAAISGLPPLNGFASEWLVAMGSMAALGLPGGDAAAFAVLATPALAFVGALAAACFVKVQGVGFLGPARSPGAADAHESPPAMLVPMAILAAGCIAIGLGAPLFVGPLVRGAAAWGRVTPASLAPAAAAATRGAWGISATATVLLLTLSAVVLLRRRILPGPAPEAATWGCGFAAPTPRMAYTASSFAGILVSGLGRAIPSRATFRPPQGPFPAASRFSTKVPETILDLAIVPSVRAYAVAATRMRGISAGRVHLQALLVLATLVALLAWRLLWW